MTPRGTWPSRHRPERGGGRRGGTAQGPEPLEQAPLRDDLVRDEDEAPDRAADAPEDVGDEPGLRAGEDGQPGDA